MHTNSSACTREQQRLINLLGSQTKTPPSAIKPTVQTETRTTVGSELFKTLPSSPPLLESSKVQLICVGKEWEQAGQTGIFVA